MTTRQAPAKTGPDVTGVSKLEKLMKGCQVAVPDKDGRGSRCNGKDVDANGICDGGCGRRYVFPDEVRTGP